MTERPRPPAPPHSSAAAAFPGGTGLTVLDVYDWIAPDGLRGGSAHVHLASTEGYLVLSGAGELQTLGARGYAATPLRPGDCVWFTPGTIHRLVNDGDLRLAIVMQNAGLPEHGDAVLTFPEDVLADPARYAQAATLVAAGMLVPGGTAPEHGDAVLADQGLADQARERAWLAVEGYLKLRDEAADRGPAALEDFFAAALRLAAPQVPDWRDRWRAGALAIAGLTGTHLGEIADGTPGHLTEAGLWSIESPPGADARSYGMCGRLTTYPAGRASRIA